MRQRIEQTFAALGDATRLEMVRQLATGPTTIKELRRPFRMSAPAITKHLRVLEGAGLIERYSQGRSHYCRLNTTSLGGAAEWLKQQRDTWNSLFDSLEKFLSEPEVAPHKPETAAPRKEFDFGCD